MIEKMINNVSAWRNEMAIMSRNGVLAPDVEIRKNNTIMKMTATKNSDG
jgi:hypothetical protein